LLREPVSLFLQADPLAAATQALSSGALYRGMLWSLAILIPTIFLGRFFCGWICPLGTLHHWVGNWKSERKRGAARLAANRYRRWQAWKYYLLLVVLAAALLGSGVAGWLDPISLLVRSLAMSVLPAINYALNALLDPLSRSDWLPARRAALAGHYLLKDVVLAFRQPYFRQGLLLGLIFVTILAWNLRVTRFWCRALCPLGALLAVFSRWSLLRLHKPASGCADCNRCLLHCQGGDDPLPGVPWRKAECHLCMNCVAACPDGSLAFHLGGGKDARQAPDLERRKALAALAAGVAVIPAMRTTSEGQEKRIRPPGALEENDFLARCIRCGECMKVCPNYALQPAFSEAGLEGLWTPVLAARIGYCEASCTLCGQVCPTGAIWSFTAREKGWIGGRAERPIRIGTAFYDRGRCLPWAMATECIVCEEWCPVTPKAIYLRAVEVPDRTGTPRSLRRPLVDPARCVGCGACEYACPVKDRPAVYVTSIGESRARHRGFLLESAVPKPDLAGWAVTGTPRVFTPETLWQFIDGDAERFLRAGLVQATERQYRYREKADATVSIFTMRSPEAARTIFESESAAGSRPVQIGDAARTYGASLTFSRGANFVRLVAYEEMPRELETLARAIAAEL
jgi:polyferredoxin